MVAIDRFFCSSGKFTYFWPTAAAILCLNQMHDSKPVRFLLITLNGTRHRPVQDAHAPATRLRRAARVHELTIAAGSDSSSTFVRQDGGVAPTDAKRVLQCHPESVRLRRSPAAKRLATGSNDRKIGDVCRVSSRPSPRPTPGAVSDELTSSACGLIGFDNPGPQAVTGTYLRRAALDRLSAASSAQSTWAT